MAVSGLAQWIRIPRSPNHRASLHPLAYAFLGAFKEYDRWVSEGGNWSRMLREPLWSCGGTFTLVAPLAVLLCSIACDFFDSHLFALDNVLPTCYLTPSLDLCPGGYQRLPIIASGPLGFPTWIWGLSFYFKGLLEFKVAGSARNLPSHSRHLPKSGVRAPGKRLVSYRAENWWWKWRAKRSLMYLQSRCQPLKQRQI